MFDWLFGSSKPKEEKQPEKKQELVAKEDMWAYDFVKQYLISPIWRNPLLDFIEENCFYFEDSEVNKFEYTDIHKRFVELCALLLESITEETGISEKLLQQCIMKGITDKRDFKIFQQVLLCDNFLAFKKIMISKNKELELAAIQAQNLHNGVKITPGQQQLNDKQLERLELEKAIALSLAMEEKMRQQEEKQLEEAIRLSQVEAEKQQSKISETKKLSNLSSLPPIVIGSTRQNKPVEQIQQQQKILIKQIETLKIQEQTNNKQQQNTQERKKRLLEQRQLIRKKKMQERQVELNAFVQNKPVQSEQVPKVNEEELERRRKLMQKLKEQLRQ